jgi:hypothetical protein
VPAERFLQSAGVFNLQAILLRQSALSPGRALFWICQRCKLGDELFGSAR